MGHSADPKVPILFGSAVRQRHLLEAFTDGTSPVVDHRSSLPGTGIVYRWIPRPRGRPLYTLDHRHPSADLIKATLSWLAGAGAAAEVKHRKKLPPFTMDYRRPLGHAHGTPFRLLLTLARDGAQTLDELASRIPDVWRVSIRDTIKVLQADGVLRWLDSKVALHADLPACFVELILDLGTVAGRSDPRYAPRLAPHAGPLPAAYCDALDGAPRIFGTDLRLRTLMALAKHGPMHVRDLRHIVGGERSIEEGRDHAPFTRGGLVHWWDTGEGEAVGLDPAHPLAVPLRRFLNKMEERYPLPPFVRRYAMPTKPQEQGEWFADRMLLFGGDLQTRILLTIGAIGWTFEALCCGVCTGYYRRVVKKALRRLEEQGVLEADRPRGPGMNVRVLTLAKTFPARDELDEVLRAAVAAWPDFADLTRDAMNRFTPKTRAHLRLRGLWH